MWARNYWKAPRRRPAIQGILLSPARKFRKVPHAISKSYTPGHAEACRGHCRRSTGRAALAWLRCECGFQYSSGPHRLSQIDGYRTRGHFHPGKPVLRSLLWELSRGARIRGVKAGVPATRPAEHDDPADWEIVAISSGHCHYERSVHS